MDNNYDAENVYFKDNLIFEKPNENEKPLEDGNIINTSGKNIKEVIETALTLSSIERPVSVDSNVFKYVDGKLNLLDFASAEESA
jgi:hypothetical protein